jgi:GxxExxY protein
MRPEGEPNLEHAGLTKTIIGAAIEVHRQLGPGFIESIYENALVYELRKRGLIVAQQVEIPVTYDGEIQVGIHRLDLLVEHEIVVELKTLVEFEPIHYSIVRSYLRAARRKHGLMLNFAKPVLEIKRVICETGS